MSRGVEKTGLREWVAGRLNKKEVPEYVWKALKDRGYTQGVLEGNLVRDDLAKQARRLLPYGEMTGSIDVAPEWYDDEQELRELPELGDYELKRAEALAQYVAFETAITPYAQDFRRRLGHIIAEGSEADQDDTGASLVAQESLQESNAYWSEREFGLFLECDEVVARRPLEVKVDAPVNTSTGYGTINLKIEPWISPETVAKFYQHYQMEAMGRRPRELSLRNLEVVRFTLEQLRGAWYGQLLGARISSENDAALSWYRRTLSECFPLIQEIDLSRGPSWKLLLSLWNRVNGDDQYEDESKFRRDFYRTARAVVYPYHSASEVHQGG